MIAHEIRSARLVAISLLAATWLGICQPASAGEVAFGQVESVKPGLLIARLQTGGTQAFLLTPTTRVIIGKSSERPENLVKGYSVRVEYVRQGANLVCISVIARGFEGRVTNVFPTKQIIELVTKDGKSMTIPYSASSKSYGAGRPAEKIEAIRPNENVTIIYSKTDAQNDDISVFVAGKKGVPKDGPPKTKNGKDSVETKEPKLGKKDETKDSGLKPRKASEVENDKYTLCKVFYATDRKAKDKPCQAGPSLLRVYSVPALLLIAAGFLWYFRGDRSNESVNYGVAACLASAATSGLLLWNLSGFLFAPRPLDDIEYTHERAEDGHLQFGQCDITIPKARNVAELNLPFVLKLEFTPDPEKHFVLQKIRRYAGDDEFIQAVRSAVSGSARKDALVFIHGYNVGFDIAVMRTAQLAHDLEFKGAPICYSWPSQGSFPYYTYDESKAAITQPNLTSVLRLIAEKSGAEVIHVIAHSMGNRPLLESLRDLANDKKAYPIHQVVLTAPDIEEEVFKKRIFPAIHGFAKRLTLYASDRDVALWSSRQVHGERRLGEVQGAPLTLAGMDSIDVSRVDTSLVGHSYYGDNNSVVTDLRILLRDGVGPGEGERKWLRPNPPSQSWRLEP